jgi:hypothetical protein
MGLFSSIGKALGGAFNAVKSFATSGLGKSLIGGIATMVGGPIGGAIANAATSLLSAKKLDLKSVLKAGLNAFAPMAGGLVGNLVSKLPAALQAPIGNLASNLLKGQKPSLSGILKDFGGAFGQTSLGQKLTGLLGKAGELLGRGTQFGTTAQSAINSVTNLLGKFGIGTSGLNNVNNFIGSALGAFGRVNEILSGALNVLNPQPTEMMLRA